MEDPFEHHLRSLMQNSSPSTSSFEDDRRLERVLHRAHIHGGLFDLLKLFANWGWVISEGELAGSVTPDRYVAANPRLPFRSEFTVSVPWTM